MNQILLGEAWEDGEPTTEGQDYRKKIPVGNDFSYDYKKFTLIIPTPIKMVGMAQLGELLPDEVLVEIEELKKGAGSAKREAATRILIRITSNISVDVHQAEFETLLTKITANTTLTPSKANAILTELRS